MNNSKRVVVTGIGPITAIGIGKEQLWDSVKRGASNVVLEEHYLDNDCWGRFHIAKVTDFCIENFGLSPNVIKNIHHEREHISRDLLYLIASSKMALEDSRLPYDTDDNEIGIVLTCENPGLDDFISRVMQRTINIIEERPPVLTASSKRELVGELYESFEKRVYNLQTFMFLHYVSKAHGLHGPSLFINNACASGLYAVEAASQQIQCGNSKAVVVAGADDPSSMTKYFWFNRLGIYSEDGIMRPFDKNRNGLVFGDGAAAIVLEEMEHAIERGACIYAEYLGGGFTQDAWKVSVPSVEKNFYSKALVEALNKSGVRAEEVDLLNPHGAATRLSDRHEALTINEVFDSHSRRPLMTAFKPFVGHNLGGCALMELIILFLAMSGNLVPATLNYLVEDPDLKITLVREPTPQRIRTAVKMSTGFGGYNAVAVFREFG